MRTYSWHHLIAGLTIILLAGADGPGFNGCTSTGPSTPPAGTRLPIPDAGACMAPSDCQGDDECISFDCVAGVCIETGDIIDGDGDGVAPMPCGQDCDDGNALVAPGVFELCDGLDNDCDSTIDEGLFGWGQQSSIAPSVSAGVGELGSDLLLATAAPELMFMRRIEAGVPVGPNAEAMRLTAGTRFARAEVEAAGENAATVFGLTDLGAVLAVTVSSDEAGRLIASERSNLGQTASMSASDSTEVWTTSFLTGSALALRTDAETVTVIPSIDGTPFTIEVLETQRMRGFASDGTHLALLIEQELRFYSPDGTQVVSGIPELPSMGTLFLESPLASGAGVIYLGTNSADGSLAVTSVDSSLMVSPPLLEASSPGGVGTILHSDDGGFWIATLDTTAGYSAGFAGPGSTTLDLANIPQGFAPSESELSFAGPSRSTGILVRSEGSSELRVLNYCGE